MRKYLNKAILDGSEYEDYVVKIKDNYSTNTIRHDYYFHSDDSCYWAIKINEDIFYSRDDIFYTEKENATHIVIFMK